MSLAYRLSTVVVFSGLSLAAGCSSAPPASSSHAASTKEPIPTTADDLTGSCSVTYDVYTDPDTGDTCTTTTASTDSCCGQPSSDGCADTDTSSWDGPDETVNNYDDTCNGAISGGDGSETDNGDGDNGGGDTPSASGDPNAGDPGATPQGNCHVTVYTYTSPPPGRYSSCSWSVSTPGPCCGIATEPRCPLDAYPAYYDDETTNYDANCNPM